MSFLCLTHLHGCFAVSACKGEVARLCLPWAVKQSADLEASEVSSVRMSCTKPQNKVIIKFSNYELCGRFALADQHASCFPRHRVGIKARQTTLALYVLSPVASDSAHHVVGTGHRSTER